MNTYVLCLKLINKPCLVVGGGEVAERKVRTLHAAGARVTVIACEINAKSAAVHRGTCNCAAGA